MADERKTARKWSLEEIDELLQDSGMLPSEEPEKEETPVKKAQAINPRPIRKDDIEHKIISEDIERSDNAEISGEPQVYGAFVSEKYRDRFFNRPIQNIEKTAEHQLIPEEEQKYERSGFVKKKSNFTNTGELSPVPNLVPDNMVQEDEEVTDKTMVFGDKPVKKAPEKENTENTRTIGLRSLAVTDGNAHEYELPEEEDAQLSFEGFHTEEPVSIVDEESVEAELKRKRKEKTENFTISNEDLKEKDGEEQNRKYGTDEYRTPDDKFKVAYYLKKNKRASLTGAVISGICFLVLFVISFLIKAVPEAGQLMLVISLAVLVFVCAANGSVIGDGLRSFKGLKFGRNTGVLLALVAAFLQNVMFLITFEEDTAGKIPLISAAAVLPVALNAYAEYLEYKRISLNFEYLTSKELYSIGKIEKAQTAFEIGRGLLLDEPAVIASQKTAFPRRFIELSRKFYPSDEINKKLIPIGFGASLLVGAITLLVAKNTFAAVTAFSASVCISVPYFSYFLDSLVISKMSTRMIKKGAMLSGWEAYRELSPSNAIAVDAADIFDEEGGNVFGIHPFYDIQIDEAILYTASLLINSGGPLGSLFRRVIVGEVSLLPPVDSLTYEDKLGLSAWIFNRRILVGNADLLKNHNVEIPDMALIERHLTTGRYPLYLAIDGKAAAVFIVSYDINRENARLLKSIEGNGLSLLVRSDDANITDGLIASKAGLPQSGVKVLSAVSGDIYKDYCAGVTTAADALLMHDGKADSFLTAIKSALSLGSVKQLINVFQICAMGIGLALVSALSFVSGLEAMTCTQLVVTQLFFGVFAAFSISGGNALGDLKRKNKGQVAKIKGKPNKNQKTKTKKIKSKSGKKKKS